MTTTSAGSAFLSADALTVLESVLDGRGIPHGALVEGAPFLNHNVSDGHKVFVKVSRLGDRTDRPATEIASVLAARRYDIETPVPLALHPLDVMLPGEGEARQVTVWRFEDACSGPCLLDRARMTAELIARVAQTPTSDDPAGPFPLRGWLDRLTLRSERIGAAANGLPARAEALYTEATNRARYVPWQAIHGDAHLMNVLWRVSGKPMLIDWETRSMGPLEWDVAALVRSCLVHFPDRAPEARVAAAALATQTASTAAGRTLDLDLVMGMVGIRNISALTHFMLVGHDPQQFAESTRLEALLADGDLHRQLRSLLRSGLLPSPMLRAA